MVGGSTTKGMGDYRVVASAKRGRPLSPSASTAMSTKTENALPLSSASSSHIVGEPASKQAKLAPIFGSKKDSMFQWKKSLGREDCLCAEYGKPFERELTARRDGGKTGPVKVACFDLDGCVVRPKNGKTWPSSRDATDFERVFPNTFDAVRKAYYDEGACVAILTNQDQTKAKTSARIDVWRAKIASIAKAIDCPMLILAAVTKNGFRKPGRLMWDHGVVQCYIDAGGQRQDIEIATPTAERPIDPSVQSFFVGDAAGRIGDHNDTDRKWAMNVGMPFFTPEEYFLGQNPMSYNLTGWLPTTESFSPENQSPLPSDLFPAEKSSTESKKPELVLFVGPPASGKTSFYREHFAPRTRADGEAEYAWVNQDTLKTAAKCLAAARKHLSEGRSVVIDNTNRDYGTRSHYITMARQLGNVTVRCVFFDVSDDLCRHNNFFRVRAGLQPPNEPRQILPPVAFSSFFANLEKPVRREGFDADVVVVKWTFRGTEEAKRRWLMHWD